MLQNNMIESILQIKNLNNRSYIHGTSLLEAIVPFLRKEFSSVIDFSLRFHQKLTKVPIIKISKNKVERSDKHFASGHFFSKDHQYFFVIESSDIFCNEKNIIDEMDLENRIIEEEAFYKIHLSKNEADKIFVALSAIERTENLKIFKALYGNEVSKQMWFTGITIQNLNYLDLPLEFVASSTNYRRISDRCIERNIYINDQLIGSRIAVYA